MYSDVSDLSLLQAWQRHRDPEAFHTIVRRHARLVYNTCRHIVRNEADAADVSQECFLKLAAAPPDLNQSLAGWLHRVATHRALDHLRSAQRRRDREIRYATEPLAPAEGPDAELMVLVDEAIDALPDELRLPLIEHFLHQKTHQEVADALRIPRRTATYRIQRGVERLRATLRRRGVAIPAIGLAGALQSEAMAVPDTLLSDLGRHALAGVSQGYAAAATGTLATGLLLKQAWIASSVVVGLALAWWLLAKSDGAPSPSPMSAPVPVALIDEPGEDSVSDTDETLTPEAVTVSADSSSELSIAVATVTGRVFDADTNAPIANATVVIAPDSGATAPAATCTTDAEGLYETPPLPFGPYLTYRDHTPGYPATQRTGVGKTLDEPARIDGARITLSRDTTVDFPVKKGVVLAGRVLDKRERGIPGATIWAKGYGASNAQSMLTDAEGRFFLAGFTPTTNLHIRVAKSGFGEATLHDITLTAPGEEDFVIHLPNAGSIRGTVVDPNGAPLEGARIEAVHFQHYGAWSFDYPHGTSEEDGDYVIEDLAPGRYTLQIFPQGYRTYFSQNATVVTLSEGEDRRDVHLVLDGGDGIQISGRVTDAEGNPLPDTLLGFWGPVERTAITDAQGAYRVEGLYSGEYDVNPYKAGYRLPDGFDRGFQPFRQSRDDYNLVLEANRLRVEGLVRDGATGEPLSGFEVVATELPKGEYIDTADWYQAERFCNADGAFSVGIRSYGRMMRGGEGGKCAVCVRKEGYAPEIVEIPVPDWNVDAALYAEVALNRGRSLQGVVTDFHGAPVSGAVIAEGHVDSDSAWRRNDLALSGPDGHFEIMGLGDSVRALTAIHPAYAPAIQEIGDDIRELRLVFDPAGEILGRIVMDGVPLAGARLRLESESQEDFDGRDLFTDASGAYHFRRLLPGAYEFVLARSAGAKFIFQYKTPAIVEEGQATRVNLNLTSGTTLHGSLIIDGNAALDGQVAYEVRMDCGTAFHEPEIANDGSWRIDDAMPGTGVLTIIGVSQDREQYQRVMELTLEPGEDRLVEIDLAVQTDEEE